MKKSEPIPAAHPLDVAMGQQIRQRRASLGVSQTTLADAVGITFQQIQKYERGFNRVSFSRLVGIAHALDCRVVDLIGELDQTNGRDAAFQAATPHLQVKGAPELLAAYAAMPRTLQRPILNLLVKVADHQTAREHDARAA